MGPSLGAENREKNFRAQRASENLYDRSAAQRTTSRRNFGNKRSHLGPGDEVIAQNAATSQELHLNRASSARRQLGQLLHGQFHQHLGSVGQWEEALDFNQRPWGQPCQLLLYFTGRYFGHVFLFHIAQLQEYLRKQTASPTAHGDHDQVVAAQWEIKEACHSSHAESGGHSRT